jgi:hypothetical protein
MNKKIKIKKCTTFKFYYEKGLWFTCACTIWIVHKTSIMYMKGYQAFQTY